MFRDLCCAFSDLTIDELSEHLFMVFILFPLDFNYPVEVEGRRVRDVKQMRHVAEEEWIYNLRRF